jgi:hypothetical protein
VSPNCSKGKGSRAVKRKNPRISGGISATGGKYAVNQGGAGPSVIDFGQKKAPPGRSGSAGLAMKARGL